MGLRNKMPRGYSTRPVTDTESGQAGIGLVADEHDVVVTIHPSRKAARAEANRRTALRPENQQGS
ncbi:hypothetical protein [Streptomyces hirsutus]|uniref:hypothetical protein n=1 Tax=Streptomyces hirsutus TaxID=35620 RepID=UPI0033349818